MAITYSNQGATVPLSPMGNGELLVWEEGASLYSVQNGYSAPHLFSLYPDFGGQYYETNTVRLPQLDGACHRLYFSDAVLGLSNRQLCDLQILDVLFPEQAVFCRHIEGITGAVFRLRIPPYVRAVYYPSYKFEKQRADVLFLTVPAGTAFDRCMVTLREHTAMLVFGGGLQMNPTNYTVRFDGEQGTLCVLRADEPREAIRLGEAILKNDRLFGEALQEHPYYGKLLYALSDGAKESPCDLQAQLFAMQSASGAVVTSCREPYAQASALPALTRYWLNKGYPDRALRMLLYWTELLERQGFVPSVASCTLDTLCPVERQEPLSVAAYLWATARLCRQYAPEKPSADRLYRGMRAAYSALMQSFREGMLPFGAGMQAFEAGLLGDALLFQGSAEATALAISAGREFAAYCRESGKRMAKSEQGYRDILQSAEKQWDVHFALNGRICRNAPRLEAVTRRSRFIRGVCTECRKEGAYPMEDMLELGKYGQYLCRRCAAERKERIEAETPAKRYFSIRATAVAALEADSAVAIAELPFHAAQYARRLQDPQCRLPLRESDTDPLLLLAIYKHRNAILDWLTAHRREWETLLTGTALPLDGAPERLLDDLIDAVRTVLLRELECGMLSRLLEDLEPSGAPGGAEATALVILALEHSADQ